MYNYNYQRLLQRGETSNWFKPERNEGIEIWKFEDSHRPPLVRRGSLDESTIRMWVDERPPETAIGGLRLIISHPHQVSTDAGCYLPFERSTFESIVQSFSLPLPYLKSVFEGVPYFARFNTGSALAGRSKTGFVLKTMWASGMNFALALSYDPLLGITSALLDGCLPDEVDIVLARISVAAVHVCHPLLLPTILYELVVERNIQRTSASEGEMNRIELDTGEHIYQSRVQPDLRSIDSGGSMTARVNGTATTSAFTAANISSTIIALKALVGYIESFPPPSDPARKSQWDKDGLTLIECIEYHLAICANLQLEAEQIQGRAKTQISAIYSLIAQRDSVLNLQVANSSHALADANRRDSSAMKTIAVLTILFLPGTFVAAFFAMPLLDWDAADASAVVRPRFYIYWIVTIPCTLLVIAVWMVWIRINNQLEDSGNSSTNGHAHTKSSAQHAAPKKGTSLPLWRKLLGKSKAPPEKSDHAHADEEAGLGSGRLTPRRVSSYSRKANGDGNHGSH